MIRTVAALALLAGSSPAMAASNSGSTNFAIRVPAGAKLVTPIVREHGPASSDIYTSPAGSTASAGLRSAARLGAGWGRVTSLRRSVHHNRRVGGVANSFHLSGRAIDIARRPGVTHAEIAAAYRAAGYLIVESLDEGDHSHLAFAFGSFGTSGATITTASNPSGATQWRMIYAPRRSK